MSKQVLTDVRLFINGVDLSGSANKVEMKYSREAKEVTNFRSGGFKEFIGGLGVSDIDVEGFFDAGTGDQPDEVIDPTVGLIGPWTVSPNDAVAGNLAWMMNALTGDYSLNGGVGDVATYKASGNGSWPRARGVILNGPGTARTATGVGTAVQLGAVPAGKQLYATLHVLSIAGTATPTITARIEGDNASGFPSPVTIATFAAATATGGQILRAVGPITDDWYRVGFTISGTGPSFLFASAVGIA